MTKRTQILIGMGLGLLWAVGVVAIPLSMDLPFVPLNVAVVTALLPGGLLTMIGIARLAQRRFFGDGIDGERFSPGSGGDIDQRVLTNTVEQLVLAMALWPFVGLVLGPALVVVLGVCFALARIAFWAGYHLSPPLRAFGFAATFYPTVAATAWSVLVWIV